MAITEKIETTTTAKQKQVGQSYWSLVWWKFKRNRVAVIGGIILLTFYFSFVFIPEFLSPYALDNTSNYTEAGPTRIHFIDQDGKFHLRPFIYGVEKKIDFTTRKRIFIEDTTKVYPLQFFVHGDPYKLLVLSPRIFTCSVWIRKPTRM